MEFSKEDIIEEVSKMPKYVGERVTLAAIGADDWCVFDTRNYDVYLNDDIVTTVLKATQRVSVYPKKSLAYIDFQ